MISRLIDGRSFVNIALAVMLVLGGFFATAPVAHANAIDVADEVELRAALADEEATVINITANINDITTSVVVSHAVTINGNGNTLAFSDLQSAINDVDDGLLIQAPAVINNLVVDAGLATPTTWVGTYAVHVYDTEATLNNVTATNGNGGVLINGSVVTLSGTITLSGNGFGGMEVAASVANNLDDSELTVGSATLVNSSEAYGKPTIWLVNGQGTVVGGPTATNTTINPAQTQYYLVGANALDPVFIDANANGQFDDGEASFLTIQAAITAATAGDTIKVAAGTYNLTSRIDVNKAISIVGDVTTPSNVVINAPTAGGTQHGQNSVFMITSSDVTIRGFKIQGALHTGAAQNAGIYVDDPRLVANPGLSNITISNNELTNNGWGIFLHNVKDSIISNNKVHGNKSTATVGKEYDAGSGIVVYGRAEDTNHTYNLTINNNQVYSNETDGIRVDVVSNAEESYWVNDLAITISNNTIYNNGRTILGADKYIGIKSSGYSKGVIVSGNEIYGHSMSSAPSETNQSTGIWIAASNSWGINNNNIHDNTNGIYFLASTAVAGSGNHTIANNEIHGNVRGISIDDGSEALANDKNSIYSNDNVTFLAVPFLPYGVYNRGTTDFDATNNWWGSAIPDFDSIVSGNVTHADWYINPGKTILYSSQVDAPVGTIDATGGDVDFISTTPGQASLPTDITNIVLSNNTLIDLSNTVTTQAPATVSVGGSDVVLEQTVTLNSGTLGEPVVISNEDLSGVTVTIPDSTVIQGPAAWDGKITPPTSETPSGNAPAGFSVGGTVISVGSSDGTLVFDSAVKIVLAGVQGTVAYRPAGSNDWIQITTQCISAVDHSNISSPQECYYTDGTDTVIWTYHFTSFGSLSAIVTGGSGTTVSPTAPSVPEGSEGQVLGESTEQKLVLVNGTVYLIENGVRRPFASATDFLSYGYEFTNVVMATDEDLEVALEAFMPAKNGSLILDITDGITVSVIVDGKKRMFATEESFLELGYSFADVVYGDLSWYEVESIVE